MLKNVRITAVAVWVLLCLADIQFTESQTQVIDYYPFIAYELYTLVRLNY